MAAGTEHVDVHFIHIDGNLCIRLYRIGMEQYTVLLRDLTDLGNGFDGTDLVICKHYTDQNCVRANGCLQLVQTDQSVSVHIQISDLKASLLQILTGMENGMMLDLRGNDMFSLGSIGFCGSFQRPVIGLGTAGSKIDLFRLCTQTVCDGLAGMIHGLLALGTQTVDGAGIAVVFTEVREHRIHDLRCRFGSCCII